MKTVLQVEFSPSLLLEREAILKRAGFQVISVLGSTEAQGLKVSDSAIEVVVIGHGATWLERKDLITQFRKALPGVQIVALLRANDDSFKHADFNCPADNPPLWERTIHKAIRKRNISPE